MKKIIAFAVSFLSVTAIFAQSRNDHNNRAYNESRQVILGSGHGSANNGYGYPRSNDRNDVYAYGHGNDRYNQQRDRYEEQRRREEMDRVNSEYDRRVIDYRNDRSINNYERQRRIDQAERERKEKLKSFAGGAVVGAVAGVLLGVVLSH
jgi:hypothetical protein